MSYDLNLYLKCAPALTAEAFSEICKQFGLTAECCPDFTLDGSLSPLCAKFSGLLTDDPREYLAAIEYSRIKTADALSFELPGPKKKWWQLKKPRGETVEIPAETDGLSFSCGIDSLEIPLALLLAYALAGEDGILYDPQTDRLMIGRTAIGAEVTKVLEELQSSSPDRLLLHEFDEWF